MVGVGDVFWRVPIGLLNLNIWRDGGESYPRAKNVSPWNQDPAFKESRTKIDALNLRRVTVTFIQRPELNLNWYERYLI